MNNSYSYGPLFPMATQNDSQLPTLSCPYKLLVVAASHSNLQNIAWVCVQLALCHGGGGVYGSGTSGLQ